jgi:hypothetical protein
VTIWNVHLRISKKGKIGRRQEEKKKMKEENGGIRHSSLNRT